MLRRSALKTIGGLLLTPAVSFGYEPTNQQSVLRIAHITDVHLKNKFDAPAKFVKCLHHLQQQNPKPDLILNGGDVVFDMNKENINIINEQWKLMNGIMKAECNIPIADADPTDFTDGTQRNVHNIRQIVFQPALAGSGAMDFVNLVNLAYKPIGAIGQTIEWLMPGSGSQNSLISTYFNTTTGLGIHPLTLGWVIDDGGYVAAGYLASDSKFGTIGQQQGSDTHTITATELPQLITDPVFALSGGGTVQAYAAVNTSTTKQGIPVNTGSPNTPISLIQRTKTKLKITRYA